MEIKKLAGIANKLDSLGLTKEADVIDRYISKVAGRPVLSKIKSIGSFVDTVNGEINSKTQQEKNNIVSKIRLIKSSGKYDDSVLFRGTPVLNIYIAHYLMSATNIFSEAMYSDTTKQSSLEADILKYKNQDSVASTGSASVSGKSSAQKTGPKPSAGGSSDGGSDSWAKYIATAKDPKTGKVDAGLNTRVKQVWQSTSPSGKEFSDFVSWYNQQKLNMSGLGIGKKDFGQEQAIALIQITGGSGKGWEIADESLSSIYKDIVNQDPASFNPESVGLSRSGAGYSANLKNYKPTEGRSSDAAKALRRSQIAKPYEEEYAGRGPDFRDDSEFKFDPDVEKQMAERRSKGPQGMMSEESSTGRNTEQFLRR